MISLFVARIAQECHILHLIYFYLRRITRKHFFRKIAWISLSFSLLNISCNNICLLLYNITGKHLYIMLSICIIKKSISNYNTSSIFCKHTAKPMCELDIGRLVTLAQQSMQSKRWWSIKRAKIEPIELSWDSDSMNHEQSHRKKECSYRKKRNRI